MVPAECKKDRWERQGLRPWGWAWGCVRRSWIVLSQAGALQTALSWLTESGLLSGWPLQSRRRQPVWEAAVLRPADGKTEESENR